MFGLLSSDFGLLLYWVMGFDLCQASNMMGFLQAPATYGFDFYSLYFFFFFFIENPWACRERATCNGLAVGFACRGLLRLDRLVLLFFIFYFFSDFSSNFFWGFFFFFGLKLEQFTDKFFFF